MIHECKTNMFLVFLGKPKRINTELLRLMLISWTSTNYPVTYYIISDDSFWKENFHDINNINVITMSKEDIFFRFKKIIDDNNILEHIYDSIMTRNHSICNFKPLFFDLFSDVFNELSDDSQWGWIDYDTLLGLDNDYFNLEDHFICSGGNGINGRFFLAKVKSNVNELWKHEKFGLINYFKLFNKTYLYDEGENGFVDIINIIYRPKKGDDTRKVDYFLPKGSSIYYKNKQIFIETENETKKCKSVVLDMLMKSQNISEYKLNTKIFFNHIEYYLSYD